MPKTIKELSEHGRPRENIHNADPLRVGEFVEWVWLTQVVALG